MTFFFSLFFFFNQNAKMSFVPFIKRVKNPFLPPNNNRFSHKHSRLYFKVYVGDLLLPLSTELPFSIAIKNHQQNKEAKGQEEAYGLCSIVRLSINVVRGILA